MKKSNTTAQTWTLGILHLALSLALPLFLTLMLGCQKLEEGDSPGGCGPSGCGPEASDDQVNQAFAKAMSGATLNQLRVGQYIDYITTRRIEKEETTITLEATHVEVISQEDLTDSTKWILQITRSTRLNSGNNFETTVTEEPLILKKNSALAMLELEKPNTTLAANLSHVQPQASKSRYSYHNLKEFQRTEKAPEKVRNRSGCGGLSPCEMKVRYVSFDIIEWKSDGTTHKTTALFGFSPKTPFLPFGDSASFDQLSGLLVTDCRSTYVSVDQRTIYVRDCRNLEDLQK